MGLISTTTKSHYIFILHNTNNFKQFIYFLTIKIYIHIYIFKYHVISNN